MKVIYEDSFYCFPEKASINFLVENPHKEAFIKCLFEYFGKKKKNYCQVYNDDEERVLYDEIEFLYLPYAKTSIENNMHFTAKSIFNIEITKIIENNAEKFISIENIRNEMNHFLTDAGIFQLRRILSKNLDEVFDIKLDCFDISKLLEMFSIDIKEKHPEFAYMALYNLMFYLNRDRNCIIYIDFPINENVIPWMEKHAAEGRIFLVDNQFQDTCFESLDRCALLILSDKNYVEYIAYELTELASISYLFHPFVQQNIRLQNKKIWEYYCQLSDKSSTFYLMFDQDFTQIADK